MLEKYVNNSEKDLPENGEAMPADQEYEYEESIPEGAPEANLSLSELMNSVNIAELLDSDTLDKIAREVIDTHKIDKDSREHREVAMNESMDLALQIVKEKTFPWPNAANVVFPLITESAITFSARAYPAIVRGDKIALGKVIGSDEGRPMMVPGPDGMPQIDPQTGEPVTQMVGAGEKKRRAKRVADYMNYQLLEEIDGWEEDTDKLLTALPITGTMFRKVYYNSELGRPESCIVYPKHLIVNYKAKSIDRAPRVTEEMELYPYEIIERIRAGIYSDFEFGTAHTEDSPQSNRDEEVTADTNDFDTPHLFLQQFRKLDLDDDGYPEPYIVTVHYDTQTVVRILANFHEDGIIRNKNEEVTKIKAESYYIKYGFIPAPDGSFYDLGFGELLLNLNKSINSVLNRLLDAGTLANTSMGFIGRGMKAEGGKYSMVPGKFISVDTRGAPIKDNFVQIQHPEPSAVLFQLLGLLIDSAKSLGSMRDVLAGEQVANQAGITAMTLIEQGLTAFKSIYKRVYRSVKDELRLLYRINGLYLEEEQYFVVMDSPQAISRQDFSLTDVDVVPAADPTIVTDMQRMAKAQFLDPYREDPYVDPILLRQKIFEYIGEDSEGLFREPPPAPQDPQIELVKGQIQVEQYKAQIREQETMHKAADQAAKIQLQHQKDSAKAQIDAMQAQGKMREHEYKLHLQLQELELKRAEMALEGQKTQAEIQKIGVQCVEIMANIELEKHKTQLDLFDRQAEHNDKQAQRDTETNEMSEIKKVLGEIASQKENLNIKDAIKPLADAIKSLKEDKKTISVKRESNGNLTGTIS